MTVEMFLWKSFDYILQLYVVFVTTCSFLTDWPACSCIFNFTFVQKLWKILYLILLFTVTVSRTELVKKTWLLYVLIN